MLNLACIQGRFTTDPELKHTASDIAFTSFTLANDIGSGDKKKTCFIDFIAWRSTAEFICKWCKKGMMVNVDGSIQTRSYTDSNGVKRKAFEIVADNVNFCEGKKETPLESVTKAAESAGVDVNHGDFAPVPSDDDLPF
jgi:single-strand DNA-binding protein